MERSATVIGLGRLHSMAPFAQPDDGDQDARTPTGPPKWDDSELSFGIPSADEFGRFASDDADVPPISAESSGNNSTSDTTPIDDVGAAFLAWRWMIERPSTSTPTNPITGPIGEDFDDIDDVLQTNDDHAEASLDDDVAGNELSSDEFDATRPLLGSETVELPSGENPFLAEIDRGKDRQINVGSAESRQSDRETVDIHAELTNADTVAFDTQPNWKSAITEPFVFNGSFVDVEAADGDALIGAKMTDTVPFADIDAQSPYDTELEELEDEVVASDGQVSDVRDAAPHDLFDMQSCSTETSIEESYSGVAIGSTGPIRHADDVDVIDDNEQLAVESSDTIPFIDLDAASHYDTELEESDNDLSADEQQIVDSMPFADDDRVTVYDADLSEVIGEVDIDDVRLVDLDELAPHDPFDAEPTLVTAPVEDVDSDVVIDSAEQITEADPIDAADHDVPEITEIADAAPVNDTAEVVCSETEVLDESVEVAATDGIVDDAEDLLPHDPFDAEPTLVAAPVEEVDSDVVIDSAEQITEAEAIDAAEHDVPAITEIADAAPVNDTAEVVCSETEVLDESAEVAATDGIVVDDAENLPPHDLFDAEPTLVTAPVEEIDSDVVIDSAEQITEADPIDAADHDVPAITEITDAAPVNDAAEVINSDTEMESEIGEAVAIDAMGDTAEALPPTIPPVAAPVKQVVVPESGGGQAEWETAADERARARAAAMYFDTVYPLAQLPAQPTIFRLPSAKVLGWSVASLTGCAILMVIVAGFVRNKPTAHDLSASDNAIAIGQENGVVPTVTLPVDVQPEARPADERPAQVVKPPVPSPRKVSPTAPSLATKSNNSANSEVRSKSDIRVAQATKPPRTEETGSGAAGGAWSERARTLAMTERAIAGLTEPLRALSESLANGALPTLKYRDLFAPRLRYTNLAASGPTKVLGLDTAAGVAQFSWPIDGTVKTENREALKLWEPFFQVASQCTQSRFRVVQGKVDDNGKTLTTSLAFDGIFLAKTGEPHGVNATIICRWQKEIGKDQDGHSRDVWKIFDWQTRKFDYQTTSTPLFSEQLDQVLASDDRDLARTRDSVHERYLAELFATGNVFLPKPAYVPFFVHHAQGQHPGVSVADYDNDGWDDIYVTVRWGRNLLLHNLGGGKYEELGGRMELNVFGASSSSLLVDVDNDGDLDVVLGRTLEPSQILINEGDRFVNKTGELYAGTMPSLVTSLSATDYNADGLLDLYFCTYGFKDPQVSSATWAEAFLTAEEQTELARRESASNLPPEVDRVGPPNVLLVNRGNGRFERSELSEQLALWRNSVQSAWSDFDRDGDPDVFVANDEAPDVLLRNDGPSGFVDVTEEVCGGSLQGCSTGACWGDFDNDGALDLYVSRMFNLATTRINPRLPELDPQFARQGQGNELYRGKSGKLIPTSGESDSKITATPLDWTWGSRFVDVDNDGYLDIMSPAGNYTPPPRVDSGRDISSAMWLYFVRQDKKLPREFRDDMIWGVTEADRGPVALFERSNIDRNSASGGPKLRSHAYGAQQPNHLLLSNGGKGFVDATFVSGLASLADGRACAETDFDRDGWLDLVVVSGNRPLVQIFRNSIGDSTPEANAKGQFIALRFVGGNREAVGSKEWTNRDGYGVLALVDCNGTTVSRELQAGSGFAAQSSKTLLIGIGQATKVDRLRVVWPTGIKQILTNIPAGYLITVHENPKDSPNGFAFTAEPFVQSNNTASK